MTKYYSTNRAVPEVDLGQALLQGQAGDRGLYLPRSVPDFRPEFLKAAGSMPYPELAAEVLAPYAEGVFSRDELAEICHDAYDFDMTYYRRGVSLSPGNEQMLDWGRRGSPNRDRATIWA